MRCVPAAVGTLERDAILWTVLKQSVVPEWALAEESAQRTPLPPRQLPLLARFST